jgi:hypothetical protein
MVDGQMCPPNNWKSFFSGPAWKYSEKRKQYFLKIFSTKMPDINYENETAFSEMEKVIDFYGELGVDGFRVDAIAHIGKDLTFADAKDEIKTYKSFSNLPNTHQYLRRFNKAFTRNNLVTMGELGGDPSKKDLIIYTTQKELDMILFKIICFDEDTKEKFTTSYFEMEFLDEIVKNDVFNYQDLGYKFYNLDVTMQSKFFRASLVSNLEFPNGLIFEDNPYFTEAMLNAKRVFFYNKHL